MSSTTGEHPERATAFARLHAALDDLHQLDLAPGSADEAAAVAREVEQAGRRVRALQLGVMSSVEATRVHEADGHKLARVLVGHAARLSEPEAKRRAKAARCLRDMPAVAAGLAGGRIGACQVDRIARVHANERVRARFVELDLQVALMAAQVTYQELDRRLTNWVREMDEDGTADRSSQCHENRDVRIVDDFDGGWRISGGFGSIDGAQLHAILVAFTDAEFHADWDEAYAVHGEATTIAHLARTDAQRRADALKRIFDLAADAQAASAGGSPIHTSIVIDHETFERELRRMAGAHVEPRRAVDLDPDPTPSATEPIDPPRQSSYRCETIDGQPIDPREAVAQALVGRVRRVVMGANGVVLDQSGLQQLFRGPLQVAVQLSATACYWPGCTTPTSRCQSDHLTPRRSGGRTDPANGAPLCGRHNRWKEHGYTVRRDARGHPRVYRPDGTELE